jgi:hypothetical protein
MNRKGKKPICIFDDDDRGLAQQIENKLKRIVKDYDVEIIPFDSFSDAIDSLRNRRQAARQRSPEAEGKNLLDETAILIVDYDLPTFHDGFATGEEVAYLARCYSSCRMIIAVNQYVKRGHNYFDLTLNGMPSSFADLNLTLEHLVNPGLWNSTWSKPLFRPWYWPNLYQALVDVDKRISALSSANTLDGSIMDYLRFPEDISETLSRAVKEFLGKKENVRSVTFREFVSDSGNGLRGRDKTLSDKQVARIAAARISKWLEEIVLPSQSVLVDAPHLVSRFPSLLKRMKGERLTFDKTVVFGNDSDAGIDDSSIKHARFTMKNWISRPVWFWEKLVGNDAISEISRPWDSEPPDVVFCEDVSRFLPRSAAREFIADLTGPFVRRYIVDPDTEVGRKYRDCLGNVDYDPALRLSL